MASDHITDAMVEAALDHWYEDEDWRTILSASVVKRRAEMRAAILAAERAAWQPIETAPRDGTPILATGGGMDDVVDIVTYNPEIGCWNAPDATLDDRDDEPQGYSRPTHWRPLPPPPEPSHD